LKLKTDVASPVCPLSNKQRKPYEILMVGVRNWNDMTPAPEMLKNPRVVACVPSVHSRKPPIHRSHFVPALILINPYALFLLGLLTGMPSGWKPRGLEIFARSLHPGFTSWGSFSRLILLCSPCSDDLASKGTRQSNFSKAASSRRVKRKNQIFNKTLVRRFDWCSCVSNRSSWFRRDLGGSGFFEGHFSA
jgi:hypothetical protein